MIQCCTEKLLCAIECFMEIKVWPIKHSVRLCSIKHSNSLWSAHASHSLYIYMSTLFASRRYSCASLMAAPCANGKWQWDNLVSLPLYLLSRRRFVYFPFGRLSLDTISCTGRVSSSICRYGELWMWICGRYGRWTASHCALNEHTAEWERKRTCYGKSRSSGCGPPAKETPQSRGNHWRACCVAAELPFFLNNSFACEACLVRYVYV